MTDLELKYLHGLSKMSGLYNLSQYTFEFICNEINFDNFSIIQHRRYPDPYTVLNSHNYDIDLPTMQNEILQLGELIKNDQKIIGKQFSCYFLDTVIKSGMGEFFISKNDIPDSLLSILQLWNHQSFIIRHTIEQHNREMKEAHAALASQMMHDVQAIINLISGDYRSEQLKNRIEYQNKVNKNYLFWIRECDMVKTDVDIKDLLEASLQMAGFNRNKVELNIPPDLMQIAVDVELFAMAFNEIVLNAISANKDDSSKVNIRITQHPSVSPFFKKNWTIIQIEDTGMGISKDFLPLVTNPFFTTRKESGFSGFGLTNAKKIVEAHEGCLELNSLQDKGTIVKLMIPG